VTSTAHDHPKTVLDLLITPGEDSPGVLAEQLMSPDVYQNLGRALENIPGSLRETAVRETAKVAAGQLDIDLLGLLAAGWRKHRRAARSSPSHWPSPFVGAWRNCLCISGLPGCFQAQADPR